MTTRPTDFAGLLSVLLDADVECVLIGGVAGNVHGAARSTFDVDVVYARTPENIARLVSALAPIAPYLRGAPPGLPFVFDVETVRAGLNFTLATSLGDLDLLGEVTGGGGYADLKASSESIEVFGRHCLVVSLPALIKLKRAAGRRKDAEALAELEALLEERSKHT